MFPDNRFLLIDDFRDFSVVPNEYQYIGSSKGTTKVKRIETNSKFVMTSACYDIFWL
jgi:hypothetical protein